MADTLGALVKERRESMAVTQKDLAARLNLTQAALSDIERGKVKLPNADIRRRLARELHLGYLNDSSPLFSVSLRCILAIESDRNRHPLSHLSLSYLCVYDRW